MEWMTASAVEELDARPCNFERMLAKWVRDMRGIDGWDFLETVQKIGELVRSIPMVVAMDAVGRSKSFETSRGR